MPNQANAWSLLIEGGRGGGGSSSEGLHHHAANSTYPNNAQLFQLIDAMPSCIHVNGWAYVGGVRKGIIAVRRGGGDESNALNATHASATVMETSTTSASTSSPSSQFSSFSIGSLNAFAAPLLFYAIALQNVEAVRYLLRLGSMASLSIRNGVTPLATAQYFAKREEEDAKHSGGGKGSQKVKRGSNSSNINNSSQIQRTPSDASHRRASDVVGSENLPSPQPSPAKAILELVERYVHREANPIDTLIADEAEARCYVVEADEALSRRIITAKRNGGMVRMVCEIRDEIGGYVTKPNLNNSTSEGNNGAFSHSGDLSTSSQLLATGGDHGYVSSVSPMGREVMAFLFPRFGSYNTLRARLEGYCGCRVGISYDKNALEQLTRIYEAEIVNGTDNKDANACQIDPFSNNDSRLSPARSSAHNSTLLNTSAISSNGMNSTTRGKSNKMNSSTTLNASARLVKGGASSSLNASALSSTSQWKSFAVEINNNNYNAFIKQADMLQSLHAKVKAYKQKMRAEKAEARKGRGAVAGDDDAGEEEEDEEDDFFAPIINIVVRPVPYAAAGDEADASNYAIAKNKTRISKELKAYEELPPHEKSLARVQALKKAADEEEREFLTKENYFQYQAKTISADALENVTKRLYEYPVQRIREKNEMFDGEVDEQMERLIRSRKPGVLTPEQQESVDRLFYGAEEREARLQELDEARWAAIPKPAECELEEEEVETIRERLTTDTRQQTRAKLEEKYYGELNAKRSRKLTKEQFDASVQSCYYKPKEDREKEMAKLEAKYGDWMARKKQFKANPVRKYAAK